MTYLIIDLAILSVLALSAFLGYRRGLILTLCGFLALFVALIGATAVSSALAGPLSRTIQPAVESSIQRLLDESLQALPSEDGLLPDPSGDAAGQEDAGAEHTIPLQEALDALKESRVYKSFADSFQEAVDAGMVAITANAARVISTYIANQAAHTVLFFLSFFLIMALWAMASHALDLAFRLPVLSTMNQWCGALVGLLRGAALLFIVCWLLRGTLLPRDTIQNTVLLRFFCTVSPLSLLR